MRTLKDLFLDELADIYDSERRTAKAIPRIAKAATCDELKGFLLSHLVETEGHASKLESVFACFDTKPRARACGATVGLLEEGDELMEDYRGSRSINAALIFLMQKIEHHEIAHYGCLREWAGMLGNKKAATLLEEILAEEKAANQILSEVARAQSNQEALGDCTRQDSRAAAATGSTGKLSAARTMSPAPTDTRRKTAPTLA